MTTPRTGSPRGRPEGSRNAPKSILRDRDRFSIALAQGLILAGKSERQAYDLAVVLEPKPGQGARPQKPAPSAEMQARAQARGMIAESCAPPSFLYTLTGRAATLRQKAKRWRADPEAAHWLALMELAFAIAGAGRSPGLEQQLRALAALAGEPMVAETILIPLLRARLTPPD